MTRGRRLLFASILVAIPLVVANIAAEVAVRAVLGVSAFDREALLARKAEYIRRDAAIFAPHPFVGQVQTADRGTDGPLAGREPLYAARPEALPERPVRVLVLGGSLARHLSYDEPATDGRPGLAPDILQDRLNLAFSTDRFVVYNAATGGGKQPQQLFRLQYLLLLGERFDVVVNVDGFNEIALPLTENLPRGTPVIAPRAYPALLASVSADAGCVERSNRAATSYVAVPVVELLRLAMMRRCVHRLTRAPAAVEEAVARIGGPADVTEAQALGEARAIWARSSAAIQRLATDAGAAYLHALQPNQYVPGSKPLSDEERERAIDAPGTPYRDAIERHYATLSTDSLDIPHALDLRMLFRDDSATRYRDRCCHLNTSGMEILADAIIARERAIFAAALAR
ncbi:MAG TPA: hypothetical protein PLY94_09785 [Gemmatimonadaceae bacterium]|nr:hypothetical protein [Gemmatimonadaceae bacterium]